MAKFMRVGVLEWSLVATGFIFGGGGCESATESQSQNQVGGAAMSSSGGLSVGIGGNGAIVGGAVGAGGNGSLSTVNASVQSGGTSNGTFDPGTSRGGTSGGANGSTTIAKGGTTNAGGGSAKGGTFAKGGTTGSGGVSSKGGATGGGGISAKGGTTNAGGGSSTSSTTAAGGSASTGTYNPDFVEFYGEDCKIGTPKDVNNSKLPDPFTYFDGTRMSKKSEWRCRRAELKKAVETYIHGTKPGRPDKVTGSVTSTSIKVHVEHGGKTADFSVTVSLPSGASGPVPAIIGLGGGSLDASIVKGEGVATINYDNTAISSETTRNGVFSTIYGSTGASAQVGWAWGVSRIIDVLIDERDAGRNKIIDPTAIGVTGCSRLGKGAFTIGAFDERIALGIPQESGTGGVSAMRIVNTAPTGPNGKAAQSLDSAWSEAQGWFGTMFSTYKGKINTVPVDTNSLVAMYAPRGLLVLDNSRIGELCATCQHGASAAGAEVYKALGAEKNIEYNGGNPSDPHNHCSFYAATQGEPLKRAIRAFLTKKAAADGRIAPATVATADMKKWVDWTTPVLAD